MYGYVHIGSLNVMRQFGAYFPQKELFSSEVQKENVLILPLYLILLTMPYLDHIALYSSQLEVIRQFYETYFGAIANEKYINPRKGFESYFLSFSGEARLEIMQKEHVADGANADGSEYLGLTHFALSVGSKEEVDRLTERLRDHNYRVVGEPRTTGDGYYESVILDPDGNRVEIVA